MNSNLATLMRRRPIVRVSTAMIAATRREIESAVGSEELRCPARGILATQDAVDDPEFDLAVAALRTGGVLHRVSAAHRQDLSEYAPPRMQFLVPEVYTGLPRSLRLEITRTGVHEAMRVGVEHHEILGVTVRITTPARTVADLYRFGESEDTCRHALAEYLATGADAASVVMVGEALGKAPWPSLDRLQNDISAISTALRGRI